jgi:hypothetical protein
MTFEEIVDKVEDRSRLETIYWAGAFILAGLIFGADSLGLLPQIGKADAWSWVFAGVGLYGMLMNLYYASSPDTINPRTWDYIWSGFWLVVGLSGVFATNIFWPLALLLVGSFILVRTLTRTG